MNPFNVTTNPFNTKQPFDNTALGIGVNTIKGLPKAFWDVGTSIFHSITRNIASAGQTLLTARESGNPIVRPQDPIARKVFDILYGKDGDVQALQQRILKSEEDIKNSPFAQKYGLDRKAMPLAFAGVLSSTVLDLTPFGGEKNIVKQLIKETSSENILKILTKAKVPQETAELFAPKFASMKTADEVKDAYQVMRKTIPAEALKDAILTAKPLRGEIETLQSAERAKRFSSASQAQGVGGEQGYFAGLSKLKGALLEKPPEFTPPRDTLPKEGIDTLFTAIQKNPTLNFGEQLTAQSGLKKLLDGHVPVPSELKQLEEVFGSDVVRAIYDKRPLVQKIWDTVGEVVADIPRALQTTLDLSATFRQASVLGLKHPVRFVQSFGKSFRSMISNNYFEKLLDEQKLMPEFRVAKDAGLRLSDPRKLFGGREEYFLSNLAEKIPFIGGLVKASNRGYVGMLNSLRYSVFNDLSQSFKQVGKGDETTLKSLADFINTATGSGGLGSLEKHATLLSKVLYAPRFISSKLQFMNPVWYAKQPPIVRNEALKTFGLYAGTVSSIITLAKMGGLNVETDLRSSNFGKMKIDNTYYDLTNGFGQYLRLFGQSITNEKKTASGNIEEFGTNKPFSETRLDNLARVGRGKLAPFLSALANLYAGKDVVGNPVTFKSTLVDQVTPLYIQGLQDAIKDRGVESLFTVGLPSFFGISTQTQLPKSNTSNPFNR